MWAYPVAQSCPSFCKPMDYSLSDSSIHGISQARMVKWVAISSSRRSSWPRDRTYISCVSCIAGRFFTCWAIGGPISLLSITNVSLYWVFLYLFFWPLLHLLWILFLFSSVNIEGSLGSAPVFFIPHLHAFLKWPCLSHDFKYYDYAKAFDCVDHNKLWKILQEMGIPDHLICLLRTLYAGQEATVRTGHGTTDRFQIGKGVCEGCILSPCLFTLYAEYIIRNSGLKEAQAGIKLPAASDLQMTPPLWQKVKKN